MEDRIQQLLCKGQHLLLAFQQQPFYPADMALGKRLRHARGKRGLTQEQLVARDPTKLNQAAISALETRNSETSTMLYPLARALEVNPEWLQDGVEPSGLDAPLVERDHLFWQLTKLYSGLRDATKHQLVAFANGLYVAEHPEASSANPFGIKSPPPAIAQIVGKDKPKGG